MSRGFGFPKIEKQCSERFERKQDKVKLRNLRTYRSLRREGIKRKKAGLVRTTKMILIS